jgi:hypothetical protein
MIGVHNSVDFRYKFGKYQLTIQNELDYFYCVKYCNISCVQETLNHEKTFAVTMLHTKTHNMLVLLMWTHFHVSRKKR